MILRMRRSIISRLAGPLYRVAEASSAPRAPDARCGNRPSVGETTTQGVSSLLKKGPAPGDGLMGILFLPGRGPSPSSANRVTMSVSSAVRFVHFAVTVFRRQSCALILNTIWQKL